MEEDVKANVSSTGSGSTIFSGTRTFSFGFALGGGCFGDSTVAIGKFLPNRNPRIKSTVAASALIDIAIRQIFRRN